MAILKSKQRKPASPAYSEQELKIIANNVKLHPQNIGVALKKATVEIYTKCGVSRSNASVVNKYYSIVKNKEIMYRLESASGETHINTKNKRTETHKDTKLDLIKDLIKTLSLEQKIVLTKELFNSL